MCLVRGVRLQCVVCLFHMARARNKRTMLALCEVRCVGQGSFPVYLGLQVAGAGR